jgi:hypothetical protein
MAEFFGFTDASKVDANPIIDFGAVSKTITEGLAKNEADRELQRKEDAKITQDNIAEVGSITYGSDQGMNEIMTKYGYNAKETMNEWYKQLTSGKMSRREFALRSQNLLNGTKSVASASKNWNEGNKQYIDLLNSGDASAMAQYTAKKIADIQMLNNKSAVIDPTTGKVVWAAVDGNNKIIPGSVMDVNSIMNLKNNLEKKVNVPEEVNKLAGTKIEDFIKANGPYFSLNDPTIRAEYEKLQKATSDYILSTPSRIADVLVNFTGEGYYLTDDQKDTNPLAVQVIKTSNGMTIPKPTSSQQESAVKSINRAIDSQMPYEEKRTAPAARTPRGGDGGSGKEKDEPKAIVGDYLNPSTEQRDSKGKVVASGKGIQYAIDMPSTKMASGFEVNIEAIGENGFGTPYMIVSTYRGKSTKGSQEFVGDNSMDKDSVTSANKETKIVYLRPVGKGVTTPKSGVKTTVSATDFKRYEALLLRMGVDINDYLGKTTPAKTKDVSLVEKKVNGKTIYLPRK